MNTLKATMSEIRSDLSMFGIIDIVLNHTANNSEWIHKYPGACYGTGNIPRLWPAWLLDKEFQDISEEFSQGNVAWCPSAPFVETVQAVDQVVVQMTQRANALKLHEFFLMEFDEATIKEQIKQALTNDVTAVVTAILAEIASSSQTNQDMFEVFEEELIENLGHGPNRRQVSLKMPEAAAYFVHVNEGSHERALAQIKDFIIRHNNRWTIRV